MLMHHRRMAKTISESEFIEMLCNRLRLAHEVSGLSKQDFAARLGLSPPQLSNIFKYRNPPSSRVMARAVSEFGYTTDYFLVGSRAGMRDPTLSERLRVAQIKLGLKS